MQKQEHFERYTPQFPLPADISSMSRQDTVCQFCGVSYLIHNEIKALETKCQKLETDLAYYAGMSSREAALEQTLQNERMRTSDLESTININAHKLNEMTRRLQLMQDQLKQTEYAHRETKTSLSKFSFSLRGTQTQLQTIRKEYLYLQDIYSKDVLTWKTSLQTVENTLQTEIRRIMDNYVRQIHQYQTQINEYQQQLNDKNQSLQDLHIKSQQSQFQFKESQTLTQNDLEAARGEIEVHQTEFSRLRQQLSQTDQARIQLQKEFEQTKQYSQQLEDQLSDREQSKKNVDILLDQYRQQLINEKELRLKTDNELENVRSKFVQLTADYEQLNSTKRDFEANEMNTRRKIDELNRSRQAVLDRTRDEYEKLLRKYTDLDEVYRELANQRDQDTSESRNIRSELERLHSENIELTKQRETLHITHDVQLKKLHDSYAMKLREAEQWPDRLQSELTREREQHRMQMEELEQRLKESFTTELNIEKQKSNHLLRKYEHDRGHSTEQLRHELISTEKVTIEQRQYYVKQIEQLEKEKHHLKQELDTLRDVLKELHEQLNNQQPSNDERMSSLQLKEDLVAKETSLFQAQTYIKQLQNDLEQTREEMVTLQETVHKECTEREQLKDALIDARQQLLTMKKNSVLNGTVPRSLHSPPVAFEEIEKRVAGPLPYSQRTPRHKIPSFAQSEPVTRDSSLPGEAADLIARPMSSSHQIPYRHRALPPIQSQRQQQRQRRNGNLPLPNRSEQSLDNQRRIARFIKHIK